MSKHQFAAVQSLRLIIVSTICASAAAQPGDVPQNAVEGALGAFDRFPLVAIGEAHRVPQPADFLLTLARSPQFPAKVNDVVIEFGNARYQGLLDRYIAGHRVAPNLLRRVWSDTTVVNGLWEAPMYKAFLEGIRERNRGLPKAQKIRVLACDPPINWARIRSVADAAPFLARDRFCADVIEREVLSKRRRALIFMGDAHIYRRSITGEPAKNVVTLIESRHAKTVFVIATHLGQFRDSAQIEARAATHNGPSLWRLSGTALGTLAATPPVRPTRTRVGGGVAISETVSITTPPRLEDVADALLHLGPKAIMTRSAPTPETFRPQDLSELERRHQLLFGTPLDRATLFQ